MKILYIIILLFSCVTAKPQQEIPHINIKANEIFEIKTIDMQNANGIYYKIHIALPKHNKDNSVFYTLDGNAFFPILLNLIALNKKDFTKLPIIVGIGHNTHLAFDRALRTKDYLPHLEESLQSEFSGGGGANEFLDFITQKIQPFIHKQFGTPQKELLLGHSFGGLFVLYAIINKNISFTHYIIGSPSLWWGYGRFVKEGLANLKNINTKIILTQGSLEAHKLVKHSTKTNNITKSDSTPTTKEVLELLQLNSTNPNNIRFVEFDNESHGSSIPKTLILGIKILEE